MIIPGSKISDINNRRSVLLKETNGSEFVGLKLTLRSDDESRRGINVGEEESER